jgi:23S rRNA G2069 N7-methylase RlmK/C1962 C5-methylase RlmI
MISIYRCLHQRAFVSICKRHFEMLVATPRLTSIINKHKPPTIGKLYSKDFESLPSIPGFYELLADKDSANIHLALAFVDYSCSPPVHLLPLQNHSLVAYITKQLHEATRRRSNLYFPEGSAYRLINAHHDLLPGLTIDMYAQHAVICAYSLFWEKEKYTLQKYLCENYSKLESIKFFCKAKGAKNYSSSVLWGRKAASCIVTEVCTKLFRIVSHIITNTM